jgi:hypothetical protein
MDPHKILRPRGKLLQHAARFGYFPFPEDKALRFFESEADPFTLVVREENAIAPSIWPLEILNGLLLAERRRRIEACSIDQGVTFFKPIRREIG